MQHAVTRTNAAPANDLPVTAPQDRRGELTVADAVKQQALIQGVLKEVMIPGQHYGSIPGVAGERGPDGKDRAPKPVLLKPGAEKLGLVFRLAPVFDTHTQDLGNGHREVRVTCTLTHITTGAVIATALGSCSTMESKYRYRDGKPKCPSCGADSVFKSKQAGKEGSFYCWSKKGGCGVEFAKGSPQAKAIAEQKPGKAENPDIADVWNTVLKMAVKRAHVAAILLATAASDMFVVEEEASEDRRDDEGEEFGEAPPRQQQRAKKGAKADEAPAGELPERTRMLKACVHLTAELQLEGQALADFLGVHGIDLPKKWGDLEDAELAEVHRVLHEELQRRGGAQ